MTFQYQAAAATDCGRTRPANEDAFGYSLEAGLFVVCDGMGGAAAGEVASRASVDAFLGAFEVGPDVEHGRERWGDPDETAPYRPSIRVESSLDEEPDGDRAIGQQASQAGTADCDRRLQLDEAVAAANDAVFSLSQDDPSLRGMGTTLVALLVKEDRGWITHVGDSRCYRMREGKLERLTDDHSLVDEQVRRGQLTPREAEQSPLRNVITRAVGSYGSVTPEINEIDVRSGDVLLLCSDGLIREVPDAHIGKILQDGGSLEDSCDELIRTANANGGKDNITCLLVRAL